MDKKEFNKFFKEREKKFQSFMKQISVNEMSIQLGVTNPMVYYWIYRDMYPSIKIAKKMVVLSKYELSMNDIYNFKA